MKKADAALALIEFSHGNMPINHLDRIIHICSFLCEGMRLVSPAFSNKFESSEYVETFLEATQYHDVGKALIDQSVINKTSAITEQDYELMKCHVLEGLQYVNEAYESGSIQGNLRIELIRECILFHHERWDGKGYPRGVYGLDIPYSARLLAVADTYDAAMSPRPWKDALTSEDIYQYIIEQQGKSFDPEVVEAFQRVHSKIKELYPKVRNKAELS